MRYILLLILTAFLIPYQLYSKISPQIDKKQIINYYNTLLDKEYYYRAYIELLRLNNYFPVLMSHDQYNISSAYLLFKGKNYRSFDKLDNNRITAFYVFDAMVQHGSFLKAEAYLAHFTYKEKKLQRYYFDRRAFSSLVSYNFKDAEKWMTSDLYDQSFVKKIIGYSKNIFQDMRSPLGALLLGVIPGAGYIYGADDWGTGLSAFLVVTILTGITVGAVLTGNLIVAVITGTIGLFFYGGSIVGAYRATEKYNDELKDSLKLYHFKEFRFATHREDLYQEYGAGFK